MDIVATMREVDFSSQWFFYNKRDSTGEMRVCSSDVDVITDWEEQRREFEDLTKKVPTISRANKEHSYPLCVLLNMVTENKTLYVRNLRTSHRELNELTVVQLRGNDHNQYECKIKDVV